MSPIIFVFLSILVVLEGRLIGMAIKDFFETKRERELKGLFA